MSIVDAYLTDRKVSAGNERRTLSRGCPQRGVLSVPLRNIVYDCVLNYLCNEVEAFSYVNDTLLLIPGQIKEELLENVRRSIACLDVLLKMDGFALKLCKNSNPEFLESPEMSTMRSRIGID